MNKKVKKIMAAILSISMIFTGINFIPKSTNGAELANVVNGKTTYTTSNANTPIEGFLYVGNGFSAINCNNNNLTNGNNFLGKTATTEEVAVYVNLGGEFDISSALVYQGSTNASFYNSYCKAFSIYYSEEVISNNNQNISWYLAGTCTNGTIYSGGSVKISGSQNTSTTGDLVDFNSTRNAKSVKIVFDKEACMGTGNSSGTGTLGTVSLLSFQVFGKEHTEESTVEETTQNISQETTVSEETTNSEEEVAGEEMNILFIGNSMTYYNTLCKVVEGLANKYGYNVNCTATTQGGKNLIYHSTCTETLNVIKTEGYDIVVLQDIVGSFNSNNIITGSTSLINTINQYNETAQIMYYMPWPVKGSLTGTNTLEPYFLEGYIDAARQFNATLAPAAEAWYDLYVNYGYDWYCADEKHPRSMGTFVSACTILYTLFPELKQITFTEQDQLDIDNIINNNIAYSGDNKVTHSLTELNDISDRGYYYAHAVASAVKDTTGNTKYYSVADAYPGAVQGIEVEKSVFTDDSNIAINCNVMASTELNPAKNATDGNIDSRWETTHGLDGQWLYVDLKAVKSIEKVGFIWEGAYASVYEIQVSNDAENWTTAATVKATSSKTVQIDMPQGTKGRYVKMNAITRGSAYGVSFYEMGVWEDTTKEVSQYSVKVDGNVFATVDEGTVINMPTMAQYGYYNANDNIMLETGEKYTVSKDIEFQSITEMSVSMINGVGIRVDGISGIRFKASISTNSSDILNQNKNIVSQGIIITTNDIYENNIESSFTINSAYAKVNIVNSGWYNNVYGEYCGSICNIYKENYIRKFIARAYVNIKYTNGNTKTIYSNISPARSVQYIAKMVQSEGYPNLTQEQKDIVDGYAEE